MPMKNLYHLGTHLVSFCMLKLKKSIIVIGQPRHVYYLKSIWSSFSSHHILSISVILFLKPQIPQHFHFLHFQQISLFNAILRTLDHVKASLLMVPIPFGFVTNKTKIIYEKSLTFFLNFYLKKMPLIVPNLAFIPELFILFFTLI